MGKRWEGLDGLRGIAVLVVVLFHAGLARGGFMGVDVFFVLSGFLITRLLFREYQISGTIRLRRFTAHRLFRLYPALVGVCVFVLAVALVTRQAVPEIATDVLVSLTYTSNLFHPQSGLLDPTWTLSLEEQFYLLWPFLLLLVLKGTSLWAWAPIALVLGAILSTDLITGQSTALHTYVRAMGLPLGCALGFASPALLQKIGRLAVFAGLAFVAALWLPLPEWLVTGWPISLGALLAAPMVAALVSMRVRWMEWAPLRYFGLRSYSLYLWHLPLMSLSRHHGPEGVPEGLRLAIGIVAAIAAAELSYRFVEQPMLRVRSRVLRAS